MKPTVAVYDTKPYDRESLTRVAGAESIDWRFLEFRLGPDTAHAASGAHAVCVFVNDDVSRGGLEKLAGLGVRLVALRCMGFNRVDAAAAKDLGLPVTRVPNYSPYSVALDVYEEEEGVFFEDLSGQVWQDNALARLLTFPNVLITAHQAFLTREALQDIARVTVDNVQRLAAGQPFLNGTQL